MSERESNKRARRDRAAGVVRRALLAACCAPWLLAAGARGQSADDPIEPLIQIYNSTSTPWHVRQFLGRRIRGLSRASTPQSATARGIVAAGAGGKIQRADAAQVVVPPGALSRDLALSISTATFHGDAEESAKQARMRERGLSAAAAAVEFGPEGTSFAAPVTISLPYDPAALASARISEDSLRVHAWNPSTGDWQALDSSVDKTRRSVTAQTTYFSLYQVLGATGTAFAPLAGPDPTFTLRAAYAFPNPARGTSAVTLRIQTGQADAVSVRVYDPSGRKVHESSDFTLGSIDDGNGLGVQLTYDHVWNVSGVGSGVYTYVITARKAGMSDIHKTGKVGVVR